MTKNEKNKIKAIEAVKNAAEPLAWNIDYSFAELMLPIINSYLDKGLSTIDCSYIIMNKYQIKFIEKYPNNFISQYIKRKKKEQCKNHLFSLKNAFHDILIEESEEWNTVWKIKPLLEVQYNEIPCETPNKFEKKYGKLTSLIIKDEFIENNTKNKKIIRYNLKQKQKCLKWRNKQFKWFIKYLYKLWY